MSRSATHSLTRILLASMFVAVFAIVLTVSAPAGAQENEQPVKLGIKPVDADGSYFTLEMAPGESHELAVELGNFGEQAIQARTYAADAYTLVNGGYGTRSADEEPGGTTLWLDYPDDTLDLEPVSGITRTFTLAVPEDAEPGEYLTSLVIQNAEPVGTGGGDGINFNQTIRQVIAVSITVPGPTTPNLAIGGATHKTASGKSVVAVEVENPGDLNIAPYGEFVLTDTDGEELTRFPVEMSTVYADTETVVEIPFAERLNPGDYFASLSLADEEVGVQASAEQIPFSVMDLAAEQAASNPNTAPQQAEINQEAAEAQTAQTEATGAQPPWTLIMVLGGTAIVAIAALTFSAGRRKHASGPSDGAPDVPVVASTAPVEEPINVEPSKPADAGPARLRPITNWSENA